METRQTLTCVIVFSVILIIVELPDNVIPQYNVRFSLPPKYLNIVTEILVSLQVQF